jgi:hypothetical protein
MDFQKTLEFILEQQAAHAAWLARQDEALARLESELKDLKEAAGQQSRNVDKIVTVLEKVVQLQAESNERLSASVLESSQKVDALVEITDQLIRESHPVKP